MPRTLLVVNADDLGISEGVNLGIAQAHRAGILTSASVMANMPAFEGAARLRQECPSLAVGVHLNLTAGSPLLPPSRVPHLVDGDGRFHRLDHLLARLTLRRIDPSQVEAELSAQVERALGAGFAPDHLDSHHHVHCHPALHSVVVRLARRYGVGGIRCPVELGLAPRRAGDPARGAGRGRGSRTAAQLKALGLSLLGLMLRRRVRGAGLLATDRFLGLSLGSGFSAEALQTSLRRLPHGTVELMCHPGHPDARLATLTRFVEGREAELAALLHPGTGELLRRMGVALGSYSDLSGWR